jgi:hypothetical protein
MKKFSGARFRELCDKADMAVAVSRHINSPEELSQPLALELPDGTKLFSWDHERSIWMVAIISNANVYEVIPFVSRRDCLNQLILEHSKEFEPQYIRPTDGGIALHPAIYHAAGKAKVIGKNKDVKFDCDTFKAALAEWVQFRGY